MSFKQWFCDAWCRIFGFLFQDILPVLSFGGVVAFRRQATFLELTVFGYGAIVLICLLLLRRGKKWVEGLPHGLGRGLLLSAFTAVFWLAGFGVFLFGVNMAEKLFRWWICVGVCFFVGRIFYLLDELRRS